MTAAAELGNLVLLDVNATIGPWPHDDAPALTAEDLLASMDRLGVGTALVRHASAVTYDAAEGNALLRAEIAAHDRLLPAYVLGPLDNLEHGDPAVLRQTLDRDGVRAVWLLPASHGWQLLGPEAESLVAALNEAGRPVLIDLDETEWSALDGLADRLPDTDIIVCGIGYRSLRQAFAVLARRPRVHVDLSFLAVQDGLEIVAERFGPGRVVFASGTPTRDAAAAAYRLRRSGLGTADAALVAHRRAAEMLRVTTPPATSEKDTVSRPDVPFHGVVDAHAHIGRWPSSWTPRPTAEHLTAAMDASGTRIAIVSSMQALWSDVLCGNDAVLKAAGEYPGRVLAYLVADPHRPDQQERLAADLARPEVCGIKVHPHTHACALDDQRYDWVWELAARTGTPVLGHSFADTWHSDPELFARVAGRHPDVVLLIGHSGALPKGFRTTVRVMRDHPNLYAEICGSWMTGWWLRRLVDAVGPARVVHGTDATLIDQRYGLGRVLGAPLDPAERALVLSDNARRLFKLPPRDQVLD